VESSLVVGLSHNHSAVYVAVSVYGKYPVSA
jgi:hypothetical protein